MHRPHSAKVLTESTIDGLSGTVRLEWAALDAWFEEDEQVFVHPRNPYARVDALRSTRPVVIELDGVVLAASSSPVMVFETGLPTRYYLNRTEVNFQIWSPPTRSPRAHTRGRPAATGRSGLARRCTLIWPGPTTFRPCNSSRSPA